MTRRCGKCRSYVPDREAQIVSMAETGSGPGVPAYACHPCVRAHGLVPPAYLGNAAAPPQEEKQRT